MKKLSFLFTLWEGGGNVPPVLEAVSKLTRRGHHVRVLCEYCHYESVKRAGGTPVSWTRAPSRKDRHRDGQTCRDWAYESPAEGLMSAIRDIWCGPAFEYACDTIDEIRSHSADLVVTSEMLFGVLMACESAGQKCVILSANISLTPQEGIPPLGPGFVPARNDEERALHAQVAAASQQMFDSGLDLLNSARKKLGLPPLAHVTDQYKVAEVELLATSRAFDFPATSPSEHVRYVGPQLGDPAWVEPWISPWPATDRRPLVLVGFSTTFQNHAAVVQRIIDALSALDVRVLVTCGSSLCPDELKPAANCVVVESAAHSEVLKHAVLVVTHGGHGTVIRSLANRVPMLVVPHGRDQNDNAIRVTHRGAGLSVTTDASIDAIRESCRRILTEGSFAESARRLGDQVAADAARSTIAEELENAAKEPALAS